METSKLGRPTETVKKAFTLIELLVVVAIVAIIMALLIPAVSASRASVSRAVSAQTLHQLLAAAQGYLSDNRNNFWPYADYNSNPDGTQYWFGFETWQSMGMPEGERTCDYSKGPLGPYTTTAGGIKTDPALLQCSLRLKPKYKNGNYGYGYNSVLAADNYGNPRNSLTIQNFSQIIVFATCAQVNTFEPPASPSNPMLEAMYIVNDSPDMIPTVHFRHGGQALAAFLDGSVRSFDMRSDMVPGSLDLQCPAANIGRLPAAYFKQSDW